MDFPCKNGCCAIDSAPGLFCYRSQLLGLWGMEFVKLRVLGKVIGVNIMFDPLVSFLDCQSITTPFYVLIVPDCPYNPLT